MLATYERHASAVLNAKGLRVVDVPPSQPYHDWRYVGRKGWSLSPLPDPEAKRLAGLPRSRRRAIAFSREIETNEQFEVMTEVLFAMRAAGLLDGVVPTATLAKLDGLKDRIAAVKTAHP